jgi:hypothetical protein
MSSMIPRYNTITKVEREDSDTTSVRIYRSTHKEGEVEKGSLNSRDVQLWAADGNSVTEFKTPPPSATDVRMFASQLMQQMFKARDADHLEIIISNANREAIRLLRKGQDNWTTEEAARATELEQADLAIENIRAKSNILEVMDPIPTDYQDIQKYWS